MNEQYYCLHLDDYSAAAFTGFCKAYYGTIAEIKAFIDALNSHEEYHKRFADLIHSFQEYQAGNLEVKHNVAYQEVPFLEPVKLLGTATLRLDNYRWEHLNTWRWPYNMKCDVVNTTHFWFSLDGGYRRAVKARFENLQYEGIGGGWHHLDDCFWGFPQIIVNEDSVLYNRLAVEEKRFKRKKEAEEDRTGFVLARDVDFTEFCNDIFGDG